MLKRKLFPHQEEAVEFSIKNEYSIVALSVGLGKTLTAIAVKDRLRANCLVVCPAYLLLNWKLEIEKSLENPIITVIRSSKDFYPPFDSDFVLVSYDLAIKYEPFFEWATMVVLDEANYIQSMSAQRTKAIHKMIFENSIKTVMLLTGTPIKNRIKEYYSLVALCYYNPRTHKTQKFLYNYPNDVDFADKFSFRQEFRMKRAHRIFTVVQWDGARNIEELKSWLTPIYFSKKAEYPPITYQNIVVDNFDDEELRERFNDYLKGSSMVAPEVKAMAALRKAAHTIKYVKDMRDSIDGPIIIFTDHRESCYLITKELKGVAVTGEVNPIKRGQIAESFQRGEINILVGTYGSMSTGYNLVKSNFIIENDFPWVPGTLEQAEGRINRTGQTRPCFVHRIIGSEQDSYILETLKEKSKVIEKVY